MTRKHYEMIATSIKDNVDKYGVTEQITDLVAKLCAELTAANPAFKRNVFLKACGVA